MSKWKERLDLREQIATPRRGLVIIISRDLPNRTRKSNRQFAARVYVSKQYIGERGSGGLPQIPTLQDGRDMLGREVDTGRTTIDQQKNDWLADIPYCF